MFDNIGKKIKTYTEVITCIGIFTSIISGLVIWVKSGTFEAFFLGLAVAATGSLFYWIASFFLYGFGQLVENSDILVDALAPDYRKSLEAEKSEVREKQEYDYTEWEDKVHFLSDEELSKRINSDDWQDEYKATCKRELDKRHKFN